MPSGGPQHCILYFHSFLKSLSHSLLPTLLPNLEWHPIFPYKSTPHRSFEKVWASPLGSSAPVVPGLGFLPSLSWVHPWAGVPLTPAEHLITLVMISGVSSSPSALPAPSQRLWPRNNPHELSLQGHNEGYSQRRLFITPKEIILFGHG